MVVRAPCPFDVYHCQVKITDLSVTAASKTPRKKLTASAPSKFDTARIEQSTRPQAMMLRETYFARGNHCSIGWVYPSLVACTVYAGDQSLERI